MTKLIKFTPFLLAVSPVIFLYDQNKNEITNEVLWLPVFSVLLLAFIVFFAIRFFEKDLKKAILTASLIVVGLLYYGFIYDAIYNFKLGDLTLGRHKYLFPLWVLLLIGGLYWTKRTKKDLDNFLQALCFSAFIMVLMPALGSVYYNLTKPDLKKPVNGDVKFNLEDNQKLNLTQPLPDIYYIVPDAYAGPKVLNKYLNFDNEEFYDGLEKKGFIIAQNSRSSYQNTYFSLSSTLNMEYINYLGEILGKDSNDYNPIRQMIDNNRTLRQLKSAGYKYLHFDSDYTTFLGEDPLAIETPTDVFARMLMKFTILRPFGGRYGFKESAINDQLRNNVLKVFDSLEQSVFEDGPKFVFAHITSPHGPYVFNRNGEKVNGQIYNNIDNIEEMKYYLDQLIFVNSRLLVLVDKILANSQTPPIIIIQSDHGFYVPPEVLTDPNYSEIKFNIRTKNFSAYYLPNKCKSALPQSMNTVNTFRFIFDQCFGADYGLLENKSYYFTNESKPYDLIEIDYSKDIF